MNKKVLFVIAPEWFQEIEYGIPRRILEQAGAEIKVASLVKGRAIGDQGAEVVVDFAVDDIAVEDFDAVVFVGGGGMISLVNDSRFINLAKKFNDAGKIVAAICIAPMILGNAGLLQGKKATLHPSAKQEFIQTGADYQNKDVVIDGEIITACGPNAAEEFGKTLAEVLIK